LLLPITSRPVAPGWLVFENRGSASSPHKPVSSSWTKKGPRQQIDTRRVPSSERPMTCCPWGGPDGGRADALVTTTPAPKLKIGRDRGVGCPPRVSLGLAVSEEDGETFRMGCRKEIGAPRLHAKCTQGTGRVEISRSLRIARQPFGEQRCACREDPQGAIDITDDTTDVWSQSPLRLRPSCQRRGRGG
jgi:hypothetical protein